MSDSILYILMRNDLNSLNAGKAMAQASHASNQFVYHYGVTPGTRTTIKVESWKSQTDNGFGTVLVLSVDGTELTEAVSQAQVKGLPADLVWDPTYPYRTNKELANLIPNSLDTAPRMESGEQVTLYRHELTCGYIFGTKEECAPFVGKFPLHP